MTATTNTGSELSHQIGAKGRFTLRLPSGEVQIRGIEGDVARVRELNGRNLSERFEIGMEAGSLELVARKRFGITLQIDRHQWGAGTPALDVEIPAGAAVVIDTASADVEAVGLRGSQRYRTASGDLGLRQTGGTLELEAVSGDVDIDATAVLDLGGKTISGDIRVRAPRLSRFDMASTSGDMYLDAELQGHGPFSIKSISGDVTLVARGDIQVEAQTITGDLSSDVDHRRESSPGRKRLVLGRSGPTLAFKSVSGDFQVVEARDQKVMEMTDSDSSGRPGGSEPTPESPAADLAKSDAMEILRALERGEIDVDVATERLAALEEA
jgi:hypothetical protein